MTRQNPPPALDITTKVLRGLRVLNVIYGAGITALLVVSFIARDFLIRALGAHHGPGVDTAVFISGGRMLMLVGIAGAVVAHVVLTRLLTIVHTVGEGDPFVMENAGRLQRIAWAVLGLELLHLAIGAVAAGASTNETPLDIDWGLSVTRWLAVLLLFVLARVFEQGARMREELAGTV